jgi:hypothetical protein
MEIDQRELGARRRRRVEDRQPPDVPIVARILKGQELLVKSGELAPLRSRDPVSLSDPQSLAYPSTLGVTPGLTRSVSSRTQTQQLVAAGRS